MGSRQSGQTWSAAALSCILLLPSLCYASSQIAPISVPVGTDWFGYDGQWSPVNIRVGTPPQWLSVFPSTAGLETWVVGRYGCDGSFECRNLRGNLFEQNASSTWKEIGFYELDMDTNLGFNGYGEYGWDTIALDQYVVSPHQAIGIVNSTEYWLGYLGLGIRHLNFTDNNALTYLSTLVENQSYIPSHSYGYTAGAYYRLKSVPSSLTLGGVDTNRFEPNDVNFALAPQQVPVVAINSITVKSIPLSTSTSDPPWSANPLTLLGPADASLFTIDSSTPYLWLPETVCDAFVKAFGLTYNDTLELYTFDGNTTAHDTLVNWNMTFTFNIADLPQSTHSIDITLPYDAFDLQLSYPYPELWANASSAAVNYFPLKRAANDTQYTIGRAFLQETYLAVDYERNNFSVSQARFAMDSLTNQNIVAITRPKNSTLAGPIGVSDGSSGISKGAIAGIAVGAALILALVALFFFRRRKSRSHSPDTSLDKPDKNGKRRKGKFLYKLLGGPSDVAPTEMAGDKYHPTEVPADNENSRFELVGSNSPIELPGSDLSSYQSTKRSYGNNLSAYDATARKLDGPPAPPAELSHSHSTAKNPDAGFYAPPSNSPNLPAYSPEAAGRQPGRSPHNSHNVSPGPSPGVSTINPTGQPPRERAGDNVSRSSSQFTSPTFSPLTPPTPSRAIPAYSNGMPSPYVSSNTESGGAGSDTRSSLGVAGPGLPRRSTSRGSRFVEEGISTGSSSGNEEVFREAREAHQRQQIEAAEHARQQQQRQLARQQEQQQQPQPQPQPQQRQRQPGRLDAPDERSRRFSWEE